uniref:Histidine decarboxylase n=1 Tax=Macrostomum lignano TaxID=282301 RepID=A0A1I8IK80_9PLAT
MVDFIADYLENIRITACSRTWSPATCEPWCPMGAPERGEKWDKIFADFQSAVMPGGCHAYFPALNSPASLPRRHASEGLNPVRLHLGLITGLLRAGDHRDGLAGKMLSLPDCGSSSGVGLHSGVSGNGTTTASEGTLVSLLAARRQAINNYRLDLDCDELTDSEINSRLIAYCSDQASALKAAVISLVQIRFVPSDERHSMRGAALERMIAEDVKRGLQPFYVCATLGTTGACAFDVLEEIGPVCKTHDLWLHVDAAYAGSSFVCPEFRQPMRGIQHAESFVFNPSKWLLVNFDCTALWVKDSRKLHNTFNIEPLYLKHERTGVAIDFMSVHLAEYFEAKIRADSRFEMIAERNLGLVTFRLKGDNVNTETLLKRVNKSGQIHMVPAALKGRYIIRYTDFRSQLSVWVSSRPLSFSPIAGGRSAAAAAAAAMRGQKSLDFGGGCLPPQSQSSSTMSSCRRLVRPSRGRLNSLDSKVDGLVVSSVSEADGDAEAAAAEEEEEDEDESICDGEVDEEDDGEDADEGDKEEADQDDANNCDEKGSGSVGDDAKKSGY